jgi:hypothetical protein
MRADLVKLEKQGACSFKIDKWHVVLVLEDGFGFGSVAYIEYSENPSG